MKYFISSDIHSYFTLYHKELIAKGFDIDNPEHVIIICGDLFDRGNEPVEFFEFLQKIPANRRILIRGNHEDLLEMCVNEILDSDYVNPAHRVNGTLRTISNFVGIDPFCLECAVTPNIEMSDGVQVKKVVEKKMQPILSFLKENCKDYYATNKTLFVHGWLPLGAFELSLILDADTLNQMWCNARWRNGMEEWASGRTLPKAMYETIFCGHWHCSYGNSKIHNEGEEFPSRDVEGWEKMFKPFIDDGIVALDSCTAYSKIVNVVVRDSSEL